MAVVSDYKKFLAWTFVYLLVPYIFLVVFLIDLCVLGNGSQMIFWAVFSFLLLPFSILGLNIYISKCQYIEVENSKSNIIKGIIWLIGGLGIVGGIILLLLLFTVVNIM